MLNQTNFNHVRPALQFLPQKCHVWSKNYEIFDKRMLVILHHLEKEWILFYLKWAWNKCLHLNTSEMSIANFATLQSFNTKKNPWSSWDISNYFHFHSNLFILLPTILQDYIKPFSSHGWKKKYFFLDRTQILSFWCPRGTLRFWLKGSIGLN